MTRRGPEAQDALAERYGAALARLRAAESEAAQALVRARVAEREAEEARRLVDQWTHDVARRDEELDRLRRELSRRSEELARCSSALQSVVHSASWRVTRPLRRLTGSTRPEQA